MRPSRQSRPKAPVLGLPRPAGAASVPPQAPAAENDGGNDRKQPCACPMDGEHHDTADMPALLEELKRARDALRESEERNHGIVETAVNAIITINEHGIIQSVNTATERMFGWYEGGDDRSECLHAHARALSRTA